MDTFSVDKSFYEDLTELWDSDMEPIQVMQDVLRVGGDVGGDVVVSECWGSGGAGALLDTKPPGAVVLHDRLMTDAALGAVPIKTEHSYSLASDGDSMPESPISLETMDDDMDEEILMAIPMNRATQHRGRGRPESPSNNLLDIKQEPLSSPSSPSSDEDASSAISVGGNESPIYMPDHTIVKQEPQTMARTQMCDQFSGEIEVLNSQQSLLKQPTIFLTTRNNVFSNQQGRMVIPKLNIKVESSGSGFSLPPTPPSSTTSDSEGNVSPMHASPPSPLTAGGVRTLTARQGGTRLYLSSSSSSSSHCRQPIQTPLISTQPKGSTGSLFLTEEEKRTLLAEGYPIPTRLPLTKAEEKSLKKIRRKIKNKISAQESRRKKKEYMDALEKRVENLVSENCEYKKKIESLEGSNSSLLSQLHKLQQMLGQTPSPASSLTTGRSRTSAASSSHHFTRNSLNFISSCKYCSPFSLTCNGHSPTSLPSHGDCCCLSMGSFTTFCCYKVTSPAHTAKGPKCGLKLPCVVVEAPSVGKCDILVRGSQGKDFED